MRIVYPLLAFALLVILGLIRAEPAGVRIAVRDDSIKKVQMKFLPFLIQEINKLSIPDQEISKKIGITTLHIYLRDIKFTISSCPAENVQVTFAEPNKVAISATDIKGSGHISAKYKMSFVSETDGIDIKINRLNFAVEITLSRKESDKEKGKFLPYAQITSVSLNLDYDFDIHGKVIAKILSLVKGLIKDKITSPIISAIKGVVENESKKALDNLLVKVPVYVPIMNNGLAIDYSIISDPKVKQNFLILSSYGAVVNVNNPESKNPPYPVPDNLPEFIDGKKNIQIFLSEFAIDTALNSLFLSNMLNGELKTEDVKGSVPFNTSTIDVVVHGLADLYGKDKNVVLYCSATNKPPLVILKDQKATGETTGNCTLKVVKDDQTLDDALVFSTTIAFVGSADVREGGIISGKVNSLELINSSVISSKVPGVDAAQIQGLFNFTVEIALPLLNDKLKSITLPLPSFEGISFTDSTADLHDDFAEAELNLNVN